MKIKTKVLFAITILIGITIVIISIFKDKDSILDGKVDVKVQLQWFDGAQFAGLYVAKSMGFFEDEGLKVDLIPLAGYLSDPLSILKNGGVDIALAPADRILIKKDVGDQIKTFGTVFNRSLACYTIKKENVGDSFNLKTFENKKIAVFKKFDTENILLSLMHKYGLDIDKNNIIQAPGTYLESFKSSNDFQIMGNYFINEPIKLRMEKHAIEVIDPKDYGINFYSDTYVAHQDVWKRTDSKKGIDKEVLIKFLRAANKGWKYAKENPERALDFMFEQITNKTKTEDGEFELNSLIEVLKYIGDEQGNNISVMSKDIWLGMESNLYDIGRLSQKGYIDELCDFDLINETIK